MQQRSVALGAEFADLRLAWLEWGPADAARTLVCVHGLTRNAHDFDVLAAALAARGCRVIAIDVAGRGASGWLADPSQYQVPVYVAQIKRLLELLGLGKVDWIGTSMGGLIGIAAAAAAPALVSRLVVNDIGPFVASATLAHIRSYLGLDLAFRDLAELEAHLRQIHAPFGPLTDAQWRHLAEHSSRQDGAVLRLHYDPAIRAVFDAAGDADTELWQVWDGVRCPVLLLHGAESVLLTDATVAEMQRRGPPVEVVTLPGIGHAPALMADDQIEIILRWLGL